jgi:hypothetical protein
MMVDRNIDVNNFIQKLHSREYMIDPRANKIRYDDDNNNSKSLADALHETLTEYGYTSRISLIPPPSITDRAFNMITAVFAHGVVIDRNDIEKKLRETTKLLARCEEDKDRLEKDNNELHKELINCLQIKETLQELVSKAQTDDSSGDD